MATAYKDTKEFDDLLTCTICLETLKNPKYLPCLHTFCESCINTHILSSVEKERVNEGFKCPVCRKIVSVGETPEKPEEWASSLPKNHFVTSMLDKLAIYKSEKQCSSCQYNNESKNARSWCSICEEAYCEQCEKYHKSLKVLSKHKLISFQEIQTGNCDIQISKVLSCEEHQDHLVEVYCTDHSKPCCTLCVTLSHRQCRNVISLKKAASGIKESKKTSGLSERLNDHLINLSEVIDNRNQNLTNVENSREQIETRMADMKKEILKHIDRIEETLKFELTSTKKQVDMKLKNEFDVFTNHRKSVKNWIALLDSVVQYGSEQQCLVEIDKIEPKLSNIEREIRESMKNIKRVSVGFNLSQIVADFNKNAQTFGDIKVDESIDIALNGNVIFHTGNIRILQAIDVCKGDGVVCGNFIHNHLLFTTRQQKKVVKYNNDGKSLLAELKLPSAPEDVAEMAQFKVAVSSHKQGVYIVDIDKMVLLQTLKLPEMPGYGLCFVNEEQFITAHHSTLTWINISSGQQVNRRMTGGHSYFALSLKQQDYIYGDRVDSVNYVVDNTPKFTYTHTQLNHPRGIGSDFMGNIYIAGYVSKNFHQITKDGHLIRIIPAKTIGIETPWAIRFAPSSYKFLVTCWKSGKATICEIV